MDESNFGCLPGLNSEMKKAIENEKELTDKIKMLIAEKTALLNEIGKMTTEKMEWEKEKELLTENMTINTECIRKLAAQYEALSKSKIWIEDFEGFRNSNEQFLKQNRRSNITRKIVLQLDVHDDQDKKKAMKVVCGLSGVDSISKDIKDKLTVVGVVDPIAVVSKLRKKWDTEILTVVPVEEDEKKDTKKYEKKNDTENVMTKRRRMIQTVERAETNEPMVQNDVATVQQGTEESTSKGPY